MPENNAFLTTRNELRNDIISVTDQTFEQVALNLFRFQAEYNPVYRRFLSFLKCRPESVRTLSGIPFLPISLFKNHSIQNGPVGPGGISFESSGTTGENTSRHHIGDLDLYEKLSVRIFESHYGDLQDYHILALLPSYLERNNSSLVYMVRHFMEVSGSSYSGFFLNDFGALNQRLVDIGKAGDGKKILLIGVTFALLDWASERDKFPSVIWDAGRLTLMETGGMKGRRKELLRQEVHAILKRELGVDRVHSEYGMTELVSQAYSGGEGVFRSGVSLKILIRDITDPLSIRDDGQTGGVNIVDLGNLDSCSFIASSDLGRIDIDSGTFEIIGRLDNSDIRGCNLLYM